MKYGCFCAEIESIFTEHGRSRLELLTRPSENSEVLFGKPDGGVIPLTCVLLRKYPTHYIHTVGKETGSVNFLPAHIAGSRRFRKTDRC